MKCQLKLIESEWSDTQMRESNQRVYDEKNSLFGKILESLRMNVTIGL